MKVVDNTDGPTLQGFVRERALYVGDNLDFMRGMNSGTVNLIATDPPFNKGVKAFKAKDGTAADGASFVDKWDWQKNVHPDWVKQIRRIGQPSTRS